MRYALSTLAVSASLAFAAPAAAPDPSTQPDDNRISPSGTAGNPTAHSFTRDDDDGMVPVETDDRDGHRQIDIGDRVSVRGRIDRAFHEDRILAADVAITLDDQGDGSQG